MTWNIPNILTVGRLVAAPVIAFVYVVVDRPMADTLAIAIFFTAAITDFFDGWLARRLDQVSEIGKMLDPIADKVMVLVGILLVLGYLQAPGPSSGLLLQLMFIPATLIVAREVLISGVREYLGAIKLPVTMVAKWKTTVQLISIGLGLFALRVDFEVSEIWRRGLEPDGSVTLFGPQEALYVWLGPVVLAATLLVMTIAAILTVISGWGYMKQALEHLRTPEVF